MRIFESKNRVQKVIGVDFDKTCVTDEYPKIGKPIDGCIDVLTRLQAKHKLILITQRTDNELKEAVEWLKSNGINLFGINDNPEQHEWNSSRKIYADFYIDDKNIGVPCDEFGDVLWKGEHSIESILIGKSILQPA